MAPPLRGGGKNSRMTTQRTPPLSCRLRGDTLQVFSQVSKRFISELEQKN